MSDRCGQGESNDVLRDGALIESSAATRRKAEYARYLGAGAGVGLPLGPGRGGAGPAAAVVRDRAEAQPGGPARRSGDRTVDRPRNRVPAEAAEQGRFVGLGEHHPADGRVCAGAGGPSGVPRGRDGPVHFGPDRDGRQPARGGGGPRSGRSLAVYELTPRAPRHPRHVLQLLDPCLRHSGFGPNARPAAR